MIYRQRPDNKEKGVLLPVFSLPSKYGIGCFSKEAREFIDWLHETGHRYWQILPLNPTGCADSPYQPLSSFAGCAYFIDLQQLAEQGLVTQAELESFDFGGDAQYVDYEKLHDGRSVMLRLAFSRFAEQLTANGSGQQAEEYEQFLEDNDFWLQDFALFMSLREEFGREESWDTWPEKLRLREEKALQEAAEAHAEDVAFHKWTQYEFFRQWGELRQYANAAGVKIIGDMPVYVSYDSADCWASPEQIQLDENLAPKRIAGVPPDDFAEEGQLWGNPLYDWEGMKKEGYRWWISRMLQNFHLYDVLRLDHFRGYEAYYSTEADADNAMNGTWTPGPGMDLFRQLQKVLEKEDTAATDSQAGGDSSASGAASTSPQLRDRFIAEDLGFLTEDVHRLLKETGFPGTKVIQFAFDGDPKNMYLPENYQENCVVYTGTHDNDTTVGWFRDLSGDDQAGILQYLGLSGIYAWKLVLEYDAYIKKRAAENPGAGVANMDRAGSRCLGTDETSEAPPDPSLLATDLMVNKALDCCAKTAIIPLQDYLLLGTEARINVPGTVDHNWCWRLLPDQFSLIHPRS